MEEKMIYWWWQCINLFCGVVHTSLYSVSLEFRLLANYVLLTLPCDVLATLSG